MKAIPKFKKVRVKARWKLAVKVIPIVAGIVLIKFLVHYLGYEFLSLNSLFTAIISANIFLIGFLISGVLVDYKESEKIPGDMASSIETLADEGFIMIKGKNSNVAKDYLKSLSEFNTAIINWFYKKERTESLMNKLYDFNNYFLAFETITQPNFIVRLKQEQSIIRKLINRSHTIRETSFLGTGYAIVEIITGILCFGMVFIKIDPFYESMFFVFFVSFILVYMIFFIKDLDNPFGYNEESLVEEVSLKPLLDSQKRIDSHIK